MNKVVLMGRLTDDIKVERKGKETIWSNFTIAVRDGQAEEGNSKAQFIRCVIFGKGAEILEKFTAKGQPLCVCGRLKVNVWDDENETRHWNTTVYVEDFDLIGTAEKKEEQPKKTGKKYSK